MARLKLEQILEAVKGSGGMVTVIADRLSCTRMTVYNWIKRSPAVAEAIEDEREKLIDAAEGQLLRQIKADNLTAIIFFLKTQGRRRGYGDQLLLGSDPENPVVPMTKIIQALQAAEKRRVTDDS